MRRRIFLPVAILTALSTLWACGYRFAATGHLPAGVSRVFIEIFENRTAETGVERLFTNDLIGEFTRMNASLLATDRKAADGILTGTIVRLSVGDLTRSSVSTTVAREVTGRIRLQLMSVDGNMLWSSGDMIERQSFAVVADDQSATDQNKITAISTLSTKLAEHAFSRLTAEF